MLLQQITDGLLEQRVDAVGRGGAQRDHRRPRRLAGRRQRLRRQHPAARPGRRRSSSAATRRASSVVLPDRSTPAADRGRRRASDARPRHRERPGALQQSSPSRAAPPGPTPRSHRPRRTEPPSAEPGVVVGSQVVLPADGGDVRALLPVPDDRGAADPLAGAAGAAHRRRCCCCAGRRGGLARHPQVVTPVRLARRVAERLASGRLEERMHVPGEDDIARLATSFNQMARACSARSASSRSSPGCSAGSSPTSPTSCAPR